MGTAFSRIVNAIPIPTKATPASLPSHLWIPTTTCPGLGPGSISTTPLRHFTTLSLLLGRIIWTQHNHHVRISTRPRTGILRLPPELRLQIFHQCKEDLHCSAITATLHNHRVHNCLLPPFRLCRELYAEAMDCCYGYDTYRTVLHEVWSLEEGDWVLALALPPKAGRPFIRHIELDLTIGLVIPVIPIDELVDTLVCFDRAGFDCLDTLILRILPFHIPEFPMSQQEERKRAEEWRYALQRRGIFFRTKSFVVKGPDFASSRRLIETGPTIYQDMTPSVGLIYPR